MGVNPIKLQIKRRRPFGFSWIRYEICDKILLEPDSIIQTEAQLCKYIFDKFGVGRYQGLAWQKKYEGFWLFGMWNILSNGFIRDKDKNKEVERLKKEFKKAETYDEKAQIEQDIEFEKDMFRLDKSIKRRGPRMIETLRPGVLHSYENY